MNEREYLRHERKSYIIGSLVVFGVTLAALFTLFILMFPELFKNPATNITEMQQRFNPTAEQSLLIHLVQLAGGIGLLILNWRFSYIIRRPRSVFSLKEGYGPRAFSTTRLLWWLAMCFNSILTVDSIPTQLIVTALLAHWGRQEIERGRTGPPAPPAAEATA